MRFHHETLLGEGAVTDSASEFTGTDFKSCSSATLLGWLETGMSRCDGSLSPDRMYVRKRSISVAVSRDLESALETIFCNSLEHLVFCIYNVNPYKNMSHY